MELLAQIEEEAKNVIVSNVQEADAFTPKNRVQIILEKIFSEMCKDDCIFMFDSR